MFTRNVTLSFLLVILALANFALGFGGSQPYSGPSTPREWRKQNPYHHPPTNNRRKVYIRPSNNDTDDISSEFLKGLKSANYGGTLVLPANQTFIIGTKLDLTFLHDIQVQLEGELKVCALYALGVEINAHKCSSRTTLHTGKTTISTTRFKNRLRFGSGEVRTSRFLVAVF
jgi:hypothetical protein